MADMLNSSRDTFLELEPTFALVLKLAVATVLTVAEGSGTAEIARLEISYTVQWNHRRTFSYFKEYFCIFYQWRTPCHDWIFLLSFTQILLHHTDNFV